MCPSFAGSPIGPPDVTEPPADLCAGMASSGLLRREGHLGRGQGLGNPVSTRLHILGELAPARFLRPEPIESLELPARPAMSRGHRPSEGDVGTRGTTTASTSGERRAVEAVVFDRLGYCSCTPTLGEMSRLLALQPVEHAGE